MDKGNGRVKDEHGKTEERDGNIGKVRGAKEAAGEPGWVSSVRVAGMGRKVIHTQGNTTKINSFWDLTAEYCILEY